jgi:heme-degrading monooxygenase HmoA
MTIPGAGNAGLILEMAVLNLRPGEEAAFESAMRAARPLIAATPGFVAIEIRRCVETPSRYLLLVTWQKLEDHTIGFRQSDRYAEWRAMLHHFYDPFPLVEHYAQPLVLNSGS